MSKFFSFWGQSPPNSLLGFAMDHTPLGTFEFHPQISLFDPSKNVSNPALMTVDCRWVTSTSCCRWVVWWWWWRAGVPAADTPTPCVCSACPSPRPRCSSCPPGRHRSTCKLQSTSRQPSSRQPRGSNIPPLCTSRLFRKVAAKIKTRYTLRWKKVLHSVGIDLKELGVRCQNAWNFAQGLKF